MHQTGFTRLKTITALDNMEALHMRLKSRSFALHFHDTFVIERVRFGVDICHATGLDAEAGRVFIHTPFASHQGGTPQDKTLEYQAIYPSLNVVAELIGPLPPIPIVSLISRCDKLRQAIDGYFARGAPSAEDALIEIMKRVLEQVERFSQNSENANTAPIKNNLQLARQHLVDHCGRDVSISELAEVCKLSSFHLIRQFKRAYGITPRQFLISQRVLFAKSLLARKMPISSVALRAGFADQSHLTRCFKRVSGFSPGQYAKRHAM